MVKIFEHPLITGNNPFWACKKTWGQEGCSDEVIKEFTMYNETGALHLVPTVQDIHKPNPASCTAVKQRGNELWQIQPK